MNQFKKNQLQNTLKTLVYNMCFAFFYFDILQKRKLIFLN